MVDKIDAQRRSRNMAAIKSKGMKPEMAVRKLVYSLGYRYRLHSPDLPGKPDLAFRNRRKVIFVHGCFWHQHDNKKCLDGRRPKSNIGYWNPKLEGNVARDKRNRAALKKAGWDVLVIWDCETQSPHLKSRIDKFLGPVS